MLAKGIEIIQNDSKVLVGTGQVSEYDEDIHAISEGLFDKDEFEQISNTKYRKQWLSARKLASECGKLISESNLILNKKQTGRPFLYGSDLQISLSHNPKNTAVIFSKNACGIDIEVIRDKIIRIEKKFLSESELQQFSGKANELTLLWSAKESLYKMLDTPGIIFKEEFHTLSVNSRSVEMNIKLRNGFHRIIDIPYMFFEDQVLTYASLDDAV